MKQVILLYELKEGHALRGYFAPPPPPPPYEAKKNKNLAFSSH